MSLMRAACNRATIKRMTAFRFESITLASSTRHEEKVRQPSWTWPRLATSRASDNHSSLLSFQAWLFVATFVHLTLGSPLHTPTRHERPLKVIDVFQDHGPENYGLYSFSLLGEDLYEDRNADTKQWASLPYSEEDKSNVHGTLFQCFKDEERCFSVFPQLATQNDLVPTQLGLRTRPRAGAIPSRGQQQGLHRELREEAVFRIQSWRRPEAWSP